MGFNCKHATFSCVFLVFFVLPPLLIVLLDNTSIFEEPAQLGGEPLPYAAECGYETIEVTSLTVNGQSGVILDADNQYDDHVATMVVNFNSVSNQTVLSSRPNCRELVMFVEEVEERQLPNDAGAYCAGQPGTTVVDNTHAEQFKYSCCSRVDTSCTEKCKYNCPVPPAVQHEFHENFLGIYTKPIHVKSLQSQTPWVESENIEFFLIDTISLVIEAVRSDRPDQKHKRFLYIGCFPYLWIYFFRIHRATIIQNEGLYNGLILGWG